MTTKDPFNRIVPIPYSVLIVLAEVLIGLGHPILGVIVDSLTFIILLIGTTREQQRELRLTIALIALLRILILTLPLTSFPGFARYAVLGVPVLAALYFTVQSANLTLADIGITRYGLPLQIAIGLIGIGLGYVQYRLLPTIKIDGSPFVLALDAFILILFVGCLEELLFRGVVQGVAVRNFGVSGVFYTALFSVLFSSRTINDLALTFGTALLFGSIVLRTRSIVGVSLARSLMSISALLVFPHLLG